MKKIVKGLGIRLISAAICAVALTILLMYTSFLEGSIFLILTVAFLFSTAVLVVSTQFDKVHESLRAILLLGVEIIRLTVQLGCISLILLFDMPAAKLPYLSAFFFIYLVFLVIDLITLIQVIHRTPPILVVKS